MQVALAQPINVRLQTLQAQVEREIANRAALHSLSAVVSTQALQNIAARLTKIYKILNNQRYNLVFIGQVGAGKTTAICHFFDLVREVEVTRSRRTKQAEIEQFNDGLIDLVRAGGGTQSAGTKPVTTQRVKELLTTGAGKTTICEVVIRPSDRTWIEIDPYQPVELQQAISDFGLWIWQKTHPATVKQQVEIPPDELLRAVRNIVELPEQVVDGKLGDRALEFAKSFGDDRLAEFQQQLIARGRLDERIQTEIFPTTDDRDLRLWLSQVFQALNVAKLPNCSIPKRIYLNLSAEILDYSRYPRFGCIIDTRGLDLATKDRRDLANYIRETDDTICIFTDRFASAPANAIQIIGKYLTPTSQDIDTKFILLVMPRRGEPEKLIGADGLAVEDIAQGLALRQANIVNVFSNEQIDFVSDNILFYDALQYYCNDGSFDRNYDRADLTADRERIFSELERAIDAREDRLVAEIATIEHQFQLIIRGENLSEIEDALVIDTVKKLEELGNLQPLTNSFAADYIELLPEHHCTLRATNNRFGQYELRGIDIYFEGKYLAEALVRQFTATAKAEIFAVIDALAAEITQNSSLHPALQRLQHQIDINYEAIAIELSQTIETMLTDRVLAPQSYEDSHFWQQAIDRWGQGSGYKVDVLSMYAHQVGAIDPLFGNLILAGWRERVIAPILTFLGEERPAHGG